MALGRYVWTNVDGMWGITASVASTEDVPAAGMPVLVHRKDDSKSVEIISQVFVPMLSGTGANTTFTVKCLVQTSSPIKRKD